MLIGRSPLLPRFSITLLSDMPPFMAGFAGDAEGARQVARRTKSMGEWVMENLSRGKSGRPHKYDRGRLMNAAEIRTELLANKFTTQWIRNNVAPKCRVTIGARIMWYEYDVLDWIAEGRDAA